MNSVRITKMDGFLASCWHKDVALLENQVREWLVRLGAGEATNCAVGNFPVFEFFRVNSVGIVDGAVVFLDAHTANLKRSLLDPPINKPNGAIPVQVPMSVKADIAEALDNECFALQSGAQSQLSHVFGVIDEHCQAFPDAASCCRNTPVDSSANNRFSLKTQLDIPISTKCTNR